MPPGPESNKDGYFTFLRLLLSVLLSTCGKRDALAAGGQHPAQGHSGMVPPGCSPLLNTVPSLLNEGGESHSLMSIPNARTEQEIFLSKRNPEVQVVLPSSGFWANSLPKHKAIPSASTLLPQPWQRMGPGHLCTVYYKFSISSRKWIQHQNPVTRAQCLGGLGSGLK